MIVIQKNPMKYKWTKAVLRGTVQHGLYDTGKLSLSSSSLIHPLARLLSLHLSSVCSLIQLSMCAEGSLIFPSPSLHVSLPQLTSYLSKATIQESISLITQSEISLQVDTVSLP